MLHATLALFDDIIPEENGTNNAKINQSLVNHTTHNSADSGSTVYKTEFHQAVAATQRPDSTHTHRGPCVFM